MAPLIGKADEGLRPAATNAGSEAQEIKSTQAEAKTTEGKQAATQKEIEPRRASSSEVASRKAEFHAGGAAQQAALNKQLNVIQGTRGDDNVHISKASGLSGSLGLYEVDINGQKQLLTKDQLSNTIFKTGDGNDTVVVDSNVNVGVHVDGGKGNDVIIGGSGDDVLIGGEGNDLIAGRGGNDAIDGGTGKDRVTGGPGRDLIVTPDGKIRVE